MEANDKLLKEISKIKNMIVNKIEFPELTGIKCNMMPFVQGYSSSLPEIYKPYQKIIDENYLEKG